jgi:hypothetical protein
MLEVLKHPCGIIPRNLVSMSTDTTIKPTIFTLSKSTQFKIHQVCVSVVVYFCAFLLLPLIVLSGPAAFQAVSLLSHHQGTFLLPGKNMAHVVSFFGQGLCLGMVFCSFISFYMAQKCLI